MFTERGPKMNEGLSFEPVPEPPEQNRLFIIIAIGLVGMLVLGLLGIGGYVVFSRSKRTGPQPQAMPLVMMATDTPTVMATDTPLPTKTLAPAVTNTPVVLLSTSTPVVILAMQASTTPASGFFQLETVAPSAGAAGAGTGAGTGVGTGAGTGTGTQLFPAAVPVETQVVVIPNPTTTPIFTPLSQATSTPDTGFGLGAIGLGAGLAIIVFAARRLRLG